VRRRVVLFVALMACNPYRRPVLEGTFKEVCPGGDPEVAWVDFERGGTFRFSYPRPDQWSGDEDERWTLRKGELTVSWNAGYAVAVYRLDQRRGEEAPGTSTTDVCATSATLVRAAPR
jgi:hypothetical protein